MKIRSAVTLLLLLLPLAATSSRAAETPKLRPLRAIYTDGEDRALGEPRGLACGASTLAVADTAHGRILIFDLAGGEPRYRSQITSDQVPVPLALGLLSDGEIVALDGRSRRLARLAPDGEFRGYLEPQGATVGPFTPFALAVAEDDAIHILDVRGGRVLVLDRSGSVTRSIAFADDTRFLSGLALSRRGDIYVVDSVSRRVDVARVGQSTFTHLTASLAEDLDFPTALAVDSEDRLFVIDENGAGVVLLARDGSFRGRQLSMGWKEGFLRYPVAACIGAQGTLFIAERGNQRVQSFGIR